MAIHGTKRYKSESVFINAKICILILEIRTLLPLLLIYFFSEAFKTKTGYNIYVLSEIIFIHHEL